MYKCVFMQLSRSAQSSTSGHDIRSCSNIVERANCVQKEMRQGELKLKSGTSIGRKREHDSSRTTGFTSVSIMYRGMEGITCTDEAGQTER